MRKSKQKEICVSVIFPRMCVPKEYKSLKLTHPQQRLSIFHKEYALTSKQSKKAQLTWASYQVWVRMEWVWENTILWWKWITDISQTWWRVDCKTFYWGGSTSCGVADVTGVSHDVNRSTPLKQRELTRRELLPKDILPVGSTVKRVANVQFNVNVLSEQFVDSSQPTKVIRSDFGNSDRTVTSARGVCIDIGLSVVDAMVR